MKKTVITWLLSSFGYMLYTLTVLVVLLWLLFPADRVKVWLLGQLNTLYPVYKWEIRDVRPSLPLSLNVSDIRVSSKKDAQTQLFQASELQLSPAVSELFNAGDAIPLSYTLNALDGSVRGQITLHKDAAQINSSGILKGLQIGKLEGMWSLLDRTGSGELAGSYTYKGMLQDPLQGQIQAEMILTVGQLSLKQPLLGLDSLEFSKTSAQISMDEGVMSIAEGQMESKLFAGDYTGTLTLTDNASTGSLDIKGSFEPRPEFLGRIKDQTMVSLLKNQLQDGRLSFTMNGTVQEPGILFQGMSGVIDGIIEGSTREQ